MERTAINPVSWSVALGFDQGVLVEGSTRVLWVSGQTAMDSTGAPKHNGDMAGQLGLTLQNLDDVLQAAGMTLADMVRLDVHTVDVDVLMQHYSVLASRLGAAGATPATTVVGVARLIVPGQLVEIGGVAIA